MNLSMLLFALHLYSAGTTTPAFVNPSYLARPRVADFSFTFVTPEWNRFSLAHSMTTYWVNDSRGLKMVSSVQYDVELRLHLRALTLTAGHESWHNADIPGPDTQYNRVGMELRLK